MEAGGEAGHERRLADMALSAMSLEQQIGQIFGVGFSGASAPPELIDLIQREHVGSVILFSRNIRSREQTAALTQQLQAAARDAGHPAPLLVMTDQENGLVRRLGPDSPTFPGNMALGAIAGGQAEQLTYEIARATAHQLRDCGITVNLAPVMDVSNNPANPVIGTRSFGEAPERVAQLGAAAVRGYQDGGVLATLKHFPGHGDTTVDSHLALPVLAADMRRLDGLELVPFLAGIQAGAAAVMIAHVAVPALTEGQPLPATIAPRLVRGVLRERLGFDGLIVSDCLEMRAITDGVGTARAGVLAMQAGVDLLLISHRRDRQRAALEAVRAAVAAGELGASRIREAASRVLRAKQRLLALPTPSALTPEALAARQQLGDRAYALATTLIRDDTRQLPLYLAPSDALFVIDCLGTATEAADSKYPTGWMADAVKQRHMRVHHLVLSADAGGEQIVEIARAVSAAAHIILVTRNLHLATGYVQLARRALATVGRPVIGLAVGNPYDAAALPEVGTYLATYEYSPPALRAAVEVLFGATQAVGRLPVTLDAPANYR